MREQRNAAQRSLSGQAEARRQSHSDILLSESVSALRELLEPARDLYRGLFGTTDGSAARRLAFQQLRLENEALGPSTPDLPQAEVRKRLQDLIIRKGQNPAFISWLEFAETETLLLRLVSGASLSRWTWRLRQEYKRLATGDLYEAYINSKPPDPDDALAPDKAQRVASDAAYLLQEVQRLRLGRARIEAIRSYFACVALLLTTTIITIAAVFYFVLDDRFVMAMVLVPMAGVAGSFFSLLSRIFAIPIKGDLFDSVSGPARRIVWLLTPFLSAAQGAIAAFIVYLMLMAGMNTVSQTLFPHFVIKEQVEADNKIRAWNHQIERRNFPAEPLTPPDASKLYICCFLAGFSERLIPDVLSQLADKAKARRSSEP